jgi:hypothetical protein
VCHEGASVCREDTAFDVSDTSAAARVALVVLLAVMMMAIFRERLGATRGARGSHDQGCLLASVVAVDGASQRDHGLVSTQPYLSNTPLYFLTASNLPRQASVGMMLTLKPATSNFRASESEPSEP